MSGPRCRAGSAAGVTGSDAAPFVCCFVALLSCCTASEPTPLDATPPSMTAAASVSATSDADAAADAEVADAEAAVDMATAAASVPPADGGSALPGTSEGCPDDMVLVAGDYCPEVLQACLKHHEEYDKNQEERAAKGEQGEALESSTVSERCLEYRKPTRCLSRKRTKKRFCIDRYEWPNKKGELPALLVSWLDATKQCERAGKRLCLEEEFNFACEGEEMLPYTYGYERDPTRCNVDRPYRKRERTLFKYQRCMTHPKCKAELERLDQRKPAGSMLACVSPFGAYDLNGNINEWVVRPGQKSPDRSGLKGGWWGPMRGRCRPTVGFHKEEDFGYEVGFRCCQDAATP
jgi:formylglycine-generating enzyme